MTDDDQHDVPRPEWPEVSRFAGQEAVPLAPRAASVEPPPIPGRFLPEAQLSPAGDPAVGTPFIATRATASPQPSSPSRRVRAELAAGSASPHSPLGRTVPGRRSSHAAVIIGALGSAALVAGLFASCSDDPPLNDGPRGALAAPSTDTETVAELRSLRTEVEELRDRVASLEAGKRQSASSEPIARDASPNRSEGGYDQRPAIAPPNTEPQSANPRSTAPIAPAEYAPTPSLRDDPFIGPADSPVLVMVFSDFQCPGCRRFNAESVARLRRYFAEKGLIKLVFRDFPLAGNQHSRIAATLAHCAGEQGAYWEMFDALYSRPDLVDAGAFDDLDAGGIRDKAQLKRCRESMRYESELDRDTDEARALGAGGAPGTFIGRKQEDGSFKGTFIRGAQPFAVIERTLRQALDPAKRAPSTVVARPTNQKTRAPN